MPKWGNSLGIRIPKLFAKQLELDDGSQVEVIQEGNKIIIYPYVKETLEQKLKEINKKNLHSEIDSGSPQGNESW
ncbi:AbrB/MazE/SpoVT family DNA-binding domain-containing protein [Leptospira ilyithenensis]|uniref:AbrB/MazE/SpoVT family DNA-binding domain-containing protein n=1 Tax=Leptospira ilyithenensis TaxID=2484901 RepID=A0A4R9LJN5_9LEPT|nr:AbrB/MazE/SpoVT family DNA-binding domain-containing protein [Leptospira ilyithenensis]TGN07096.1 AbrB/MazE/SpoVT family DNA-binding domain-containing protein [Leptospira ilyithenensis]